MKKKPSRNSRSLPQPKQRTIVLGVHKAPRNVAERIHSQLWKMSLGNKIIDYVSGHGRKEAVFYVVATRKEQATVRAVIKQFTER